jgi:DNA invertase Pin-like site-specific DNA recombinase
VKVGYARVSSRDQRLGPQRDALLADGCEKVFEEKISSREAEWNALGRLSTTAVRKTCWL